MASGPRRWRAANGDPAHRESRVGEAKCRTFRLRITIKVKHGDTLSPLQQHIAELTMPARRQHAVRAVLSIGAPAAPLLAADGRELWRRAIGSCGPLFVRAPVSTGH